MRQDIDADAYGLELGRCLENPAGNTGPVQHQPQGQAADAGADNQNFHGDPPLLAYSSRPASAARALPSDPSSPRRQGTARSERRNRRVKFRETSRPLRRSGLSEYFRAA